MAAPELAPRREDLEARLVGVDAAPIGEEPERLVVVLGAPHLPPRLFGVSKSAADRIIDHLGPMIALRPRKCFANDTVLIVDGTLAPPGDHTNAERSKNYRSSTNHQVVIDADTRHVVLAGRPEPGNRNDCEAWEESGAEAAVGTTTTLADGGCPGIGLVCLTGAAKPRNCPVGGRPATNPTSRFAPASSTSLPA